MQFEIEIGVIDYEVFVKNKMNQNNFVCYDSLGQKFPKNKN